MICKSNQVEEQLRCEAQTIGYVVLHRRDKEQHGEQGETRMKNMTGGQNSTQDVFQI